MSRLKRVLIGLLVLLVLGAGGLLAGLPGWGAGPGVPVAYAGSCDGFPPPPEPDCPPTPTPTPPPGH